MGINTDPEKIEEVLTRGVEEIIKIEHLRKRLLSGEKLIIKHGIDPTAPDLHLGNAVILWKLKEFQGLGHKVIFIIGDFTAQIGDPSGRLSVRKRLSEKEVKENMKTYKEQVGKILNLRKIEIVYNNQHFSTMSFSEFYRLSHFFSVNQILERDMFQERRKQKKPIWLNEFFYPIFQAYDSVAIKADVEIGGSDQLFNMLMGRQLQPYFNQPPQDVITMKLLVGTDGKRKMSKSFRNYIGIQEPPNEQYGKIMSIKDEIIPTYFELCTKIPLKEIKEMENQLKIKRTNPREIKVRLAIEVVRLYHGEKKAEESEKEFERVFKEKKLPTKIPEIKIKERKLNILDLLVKTNLAPSKSGAKRLVLQRGAKINGELKEDWRETINLDQGMIVQVGRRKFVKIG